MEKILNTWYFKYLSCAGRLTLIKSVLEATIVYWMSLACFPRGILTRIQSLYCRSLWQGNKQDKIFAWVRWEALKLPKKWGVSDLKKLEYFSLALAAKLEWKLVSANSLWTRVTYAKYIAPMHIMDWIRRTHLSTSSISIIWKAVLKALNPIKEGLTWRI